MPVYTCASAGSNALQTSRWRRVTEHLYSALRETAMCADTSQSLLTVAAVSVQYGKTSALSCLDLNLYAGDTLGLLGLNGAGKSSLLKVIAGVLAPTAGNRQLIARVPAAHQSGASADPSTKSADS